MKYFVIVCTFFGSVCAAPIGEWVQTNPVSNQNFDNMNVKVGVDGKCNAVAVWVHAEEQNDDQVIQGAKLPFGSKTWTPTSTIAQTNESFRAPLIEVAPNGDAVILYENFDSKLFGARLVAGATTWDLTAPSPIATTNTLINRLPYSLAMNASGDAIAAWSQLDNGNRIIRAARLPAGSTTWELTDDVIAVVTTTENSSPAVAINDCGDAVVIWQAVDNVDDVLLGARLSQGSDQWELTDTIYTGSIDAADPPYNVVLDNSGRAIAVFSTGAIIRGAKLPKGSLDWVDTSDLSSGTRDILPKIKIDGPRCIAVAIWEMREPQATKTLLPDDLIQGAVLPFDDLTWVPTNDLNTERNGTQAQLAMDDFGNAIAVWRGGNMFIEGATLDAGSTTWVNTNDLRMAGMSEQVLLPDVGVSPNGQLAVGAWTLEGSGFEQIEAATNCSPFAPQPPGLITGKQVINQFSSQTECFNRIFWTASPSLNLDFYRVFRNGVLVATVSARTGGLIYEDHNRKKGVTTTYEVRAVGTNGKASEPISITIP